MPRFVAHPTLYKGVMFRSRLEARWAAYFDLRGWSWVYEPFDLRGYSPDFSVTTAEDEHPALPSAPYLVEVKPATKVGQLKGPIGRILRTGWNGPWMVVGADPDVCMEGHGKHHRARRYLGRENPQAWADASNTTQWKGVLASVIKQPLKMCVRCGRQDHALHHRFCK